MSRLVADVVSAFAPTCDHTATCITCGDLALPLTVQQVDADRGLALCADEEGRSETVETDLVAPVAPGQVILVHAGTAIARLDDEAAGGGGGHMAAGAGSREVLP